MRKKPIIFALIFIILSAVATLVSPMLISHIIDKYIQTKQFKGVIIFSSILLLVYIVGLVSNYFQTTIMGGVGRRILFNLRNNIFNKLQELPIAFFNQNKAGDLISRINNDTDKLNQFFCTGVYTIYKWILCNFRNGNIYNICKSKAWFYSVITSIICSAYNKIFIWLGKR